MAWFAEWWHGGPAAVEPATLRDARMLARLHAESFHRGWGEGEFESMLTERNTLVHRLRAGRRIIGFAVSRMAAEFGLPRPEPFPAEALSDGQQQVDEMLSRIHDRRALKEPELVLARELAEGDHRAAEGDRADRRAEDQLEPVAGRSPPVGRAGRGPAGGMDRSRTGVPIRDVRRRYRPDRRRGRP